MPARRRRYDSSTRSRRTRSIVSSFFLRELRGREKKFKIRGFHARKLSKTLGAFLQFPIFSHDPRLCGEVLLRLGCSAFICAHRWFHFVQFTQTRPAKYFRGTDPSVKFRQIRIP